MGTTAAGNWGHHLGSMRNMNQHAVSFDTGTSMYIDYAEWRDGDLPVWCGPDPFMSSRLNFHTPRGSPS